MPTSGPHLLRLAAFCALGFGLATGCASHEGEPPTPKTPETNTQTPEEKDPPPPQKVLAQASIASVQMIQDCPEDDPPPAAKKPMPPAKPAEAEPADEPPPADEAMEQPAQGARARGASMASPMVGDSARGGVGFKQPCTQSMVQFAFKGQGDQPGKVNVKSLVLLAPGGDKVIGKVKARVPTAWKDGNYEAWDEVIPAKTDLKASYRISVPNWGDLEKKLGKGSYGEMFVLEVALEIDGVEQVIRSPEFPREEPHVVVT